MAGVLPGLGSGSWTVNALGTDRARLTLRQECRTGLVFTGARGGQLRRNNFRRIWLRAIEATGLGDVHFHDLRHTGNTLAATGGATTRELMQRMGHSSVRAALICQHLVNGRDHAIADHVDRQIRKVRERDG
ncbi:tyrosine-type recombinase/integrase [Streptomyces sp. NPDC057445]|uniref:tyrosine-type recombinase/integrase n=1 Tax=Streptomyces sp. NPDC057445 TaxID=3346136 RepID=UPI00367BFAEB